MYWRVVHRVSFLSPPLVHSWVFFLAANTSVVSHGYARRSCSDCDSLIKSKENSGGRSCVSFQAVSLWKCWMAAQMVLYFLYYYTLSHTHTHTLCGWLSCRHRRKTAPTFRSIQPKSSNNPHSLFTNNKMCLCPPENI